MKSGVGPEAMVAVEKWANDLKVEVNRLKLQSAGAKAIASYKESRGFQLGLKMMGQVTYEFGYRVALERF
ncbi:hypothetical protein BHE74_00029214 [Ensete ventricosum]|nr:hypothetical protein GW17_00036866 [Ensete ventricosum]RWW63585.1 hypothetical protein BHE74_00029214 [Ensete ventricosum]RZR85269.1 hypothetical protein BHM03_00012224 [Ensete ventricosum]